MATVTVSLVAAAALLLPTLGGVAARAQTADPPYKPFGVLPSSVAPLSTEKQSTVNPFPFGGGNAQNRAWAADDLYWGLLDGNVPWNTEPLTRGGVANSEISLDGWQFPRLTDIDNVLAGPISINDPNGLNRPNIAVLTATAFVDGVPPASNFVKAPTIPVSPSTTVPSYNIVSYDTTSSALNYYESFAQPRPASSALSYDASNKFLWRLDNPTPVSPATTVNIPGAAGVQNRYRIFVHIPTPQTPTAYTSNNGNAYVENRIDDARYTVYYYVKVGTTYQPRQLVCALVSQTAGGDFELKAADGSEPVFPLFSSATFASTGIVSATAAITLPAQPTYAVGGPTSTMQGTPPVPPASPLIQGVALDNSTGDTLVQTSSVQFVLADSISLQPGVESINATPTITPAHGGSKTIPSSAAPGAIAVQSKTYLPNSPDAAYSAAANAPHMDDTGSIFSDGSGIHSYVNDVNDPLYSGMGYANYTPWDVSTYFQGPASLIDPRYTGTDVTGNTFTGAQVGPIDPYLSDRPTLISFPTAASSLLNQFFLRAGRSTDATNNLRYGTELATTSNPNYGTPYFSHSQVIIAKTYYVQDPENGVSNPTGIKTEQVGAIYALDWQTGVPVWRFPDRTYLPTNATLNGTTAIPGAGLRNTLLGVDPDTKQSVFTVPGVIAIDVNGDGNITDDEVFLGTSQKLTDGTYVTAGANTSGAVNASVTISPRVLVQGIVQVPVHDVTWTTATATEPSDITAIAPATAGRYYVPGTNAYNPVPIGMAFIAAGNGVLYAVDAYGNNDTRYFDGGVIPTSTGGFYNGGTYFGTYSPGTTNVFWTFSANSHGPQPANGNTAAETKGTYSERVQQEVPATASFGGSAPVLAWNYTDSELNKTSPPADAALQLFVGNTNGVLYAMDPTAKAGYVTAVDPMTNMIINVGVQPLPYVKGGQPDDTYYGGANALVDGPTGANYKAELKWWYRTQGGINFAPSVSMYRHDLSSFSLAVEKGVYVSSSEGRVYCVDWDGPMSLGGSLTRIGAYDGTGGAAKAFNDDIYFHNTLPANMNGIADNEQGTVRPRWAFPNLYRTNTGADVNNPTTMPADAALAPSVAGATLAEPQSLGPVQTPPVLMDFLWQDPDNGTSAAAMMDYVAVTANDPVSSGALPTTSRVYLLDQIGDPVDFLTNPRTQTNSGGTKTAISQPRDRYSPSKLLCATDPTIPSGLTWSYRYQYDAYPNGASGPTVQDVNAIQLRNMPLFDLTGTGGTYNSSINAYDPFLPVTNLTLQDIGQATGMPPASEFMHQPGRRMLPTLFAGGLGEVYALDIDPETGVFMRWRPTLAEQELFTPLSSRILQGLDLYPGDPATTGTMSTLDQLSPLDSIFDGASAFGYTRSSLGTQEILARLAPLNDEGSGVTWLTVTGGPTQSRSNRIPENGNAQVDPSIPAHPTNDLPNLLPFAIATVVPNSNPSLGSSVTRGDGTTASTVDADGLVAATSTSSNSSLTLGGHVTGKVNQDINDPVATQAGRIASDPTTIPAAKIPNAAMPYPILFVSTIGSYIHALSTNIEGEDRRSPTPVATANDPSNLAALNDSHPTSWAFAPPGNTKRINIHGHVNLLTIKGPGGLAGIAVFSNAYFPATDPYAADYRRAASGTSLNIAPNLIADEPNTTAPTPSGPDGAGGQVTDPDDPTHPRPDFHPRPFVYAQMGVSGTNPTTVDDAHTGLSGFPLDLNGHFFDRAYAGAGGATQFPALKTLASNTITSFAGGTFGYSNSKNFNNDGQHPFGDYHIWPRVPGYSNIGTQLDKNTSTNLGLAYGDINNQTPDGVRTIDTNGPFRPDTRLPALPAGANPQPADQISDDINPAGQDVAWFYTGGDNGVVYAYTPAVMGHDTGLEGGTIYLGQFSEANGQDGSYTPPFSAQEDGADGSNPQVDIYSNDDINAILSELAGTPTATNLTRNGTGLTWQGRSIGYRGGKNYYEWGETVNILVYDALARPFVAYSRRPRQYVPSIPVVGGVPQGGADRSIQLNIATYQGTAVANPVISLEGANYLTDGTGRLLQYYQANDGTYHTYNATTSPASAIPLGVAVYHYVLGANPGAGNTQTPGELLKVTVVSNGGVPVSQSASGLGEDPATQNRHSPDAYFSIANPLAVKGFLTASVGNTAVPINPAVPTGGYDVNSVGPFKSQASQYTGSVKQDDSTTVDPSQAGSEYWQALTNGNTLHRYDTKPYITQTISGMTFTIPNTDLGSPIRIGGQGFEPAFYFPVAASTGFINHGTTGSTEGGSGSATEYFRLMNRSLVTGGLLPRVRVEPSDQPADLSFRAWPGKIMNGDVDATVNTRITPSGMDAFGRINPLPWEGIPATARPYDPSADVNHSLDYPDIQGRQNHAIQVLSAAGDLTNIPGTLFATVSLNADNTPNENTVIAAFTPGSTYSGPNAGIPSNLAVSVAIAMPKYQPANLVSAQELTSTYQASNPLDLPTGMTLSSSVAPGPLQMPRGVANRLLSYNGNQVVTPFGYTTRLVAYIDADGSGKLNPSSVAFRVSGTNPYGIATLNQSTKPYREFEVWAGVPVDQSLKIVESVIDLGALSQGFAQQNGLLGYSASANNATGIGLEPLNADYFPSNLFSTNYNALFSGNPNYFKTFTVQNPGNVNDYNLRPSQKTEAAPYDGTGGAYNYFLMRSATVDPNFGILAVGADPLLPAIPHLNKNVMPQIVTSLDPMFDTLWDAQTQAALEASLGTMAGDAAYNAIFKNFGGKHTLHKPKPGSQTPSVLGIPDQPTAQQIVAGAQIPSSTPAVAVSVPLGTPVGVYSSSLGNSPFTIFEDHDTPNYVAIPQVPTGSGMLTLSPTITPAGPLYHGQNAAPPGTNPIYSGGTSTTGEDVWRAQTVGVPATATTAAVPPVFLPYTYPYLTIKAQVIESGLTGQFPDLAAAATPNVTTGILPSIDPQPVVTSATGTDAKGMATMFYRPSAALTPAAWRDTNGTMHVYYSRNDSAGTSAMTGANPGAPYLLYHSSLAWDNTNGVFKADTPGVPLGVPSATGGHWMTAPVSLPTSGAINTTGVESNVSPYVLTHLGSTNVPDAATLFFTNSVANPNGSLHNRIFFVDVTSDGKGSSPSEYFINGDPTVARFAPRAAFDAADGMDEMMYYGGGAGRWSIFYVPRTATNGLPSGTTPDASKTAGVEALLPMPAAIISASEPSPVYRVLSNAAGTASTPIVDVYFTGISKTTQTPDIYMNRYTINGTTGALTLSPLPSVTDESLTSIGRNGVWRSQSLAWVLDPTAPPATPLPIVKWTHNGTNQMTNAANWKYDASTGILYQAVGGTPATLTYVYVDASAGTVQFRGSQAPLVTESATATYTPQTARLTSDGATNFGSFTFTDPQILAATPTGQGNVIRRSQALHSGRNYLVWQKGPSAGKSPTLYNAVRRIGIDLQIPANQSILLGAPNANGDQTPTVSNVTIGGNAVPYDVDFINGRIFVEDQWQGQTISVTYTLVTRGTQGSAGYAPTQMTKTGALQYLDELNVGVQGNFGAALPITAGINEGQAAAMIDLFDWTRSNSRTDPPSLSTGGQYDPTLVPGRVWILWSSPRGRTGTTTTTPDPFPSGYNLYWETIAPNFEGSAFYSTSSRN